MLASTRRLLVLSLPPPLFGVLSVAVPIALLFRAVDEIPEGNLIDDPPVYEMPDIAPALRGSAATILVCSLMVLVVVAVFVIDAARRPRMEGEHTPRI
jgi:hypothetical protein